MVRTFFDDSAASPMQAFLGSSHGAVTESELARLSEIIEEIIERARRRKGRA